jgi:murein endopeptidase
MRRLLTTIFLSASLCGAAVALAQDTTSLSQREFDPVLWRDSTPIGLPHKGALVNGVQLPADGADHFTWDFPLGAAPNRPWRRWGTDDTVRKLMRVMAQFSAAHPFGPRIGIADLSRPKGGAFGRRYGGLGHASHQNGTDIDILYPRRDRLELEPTAVSQIDRALSQDLVDRFIAAGAVYVFVGPRTGLVGPKRRVQRLVHHDNHMHVRFRR